MGSSVLPMENTTLRKPASEPPIFQVPSFKGRFGLSQEHAEIADLAAMGYPIAAIARKVGRSSASTISNTLTSIFNKTTANTKHDLLLIALGLPTLSFEDRKSCQ